jgi:hypothetical protein
MLPRPRGDVEVLETMQLAERKGETLALVGGEELIDIDGMNRLITVVVATTVAQGLPASREAGQEEVSHGA